MSALREMPDAAPHTNIALERQVLGQMLSSADGWELYTAAGIRQDDFFRDAHRLLFAAAKAVADSGVTPDLLTVRLELRRTGKSDAVGVVYLSELVGGCVRPTPEAAEFVARELADLAAMRWAARKLDAGDLVGAGEVLDAAQARLSERRRVYDAEGQLDALRDDIARDRAGRVWLGIPSLDNILDGLRPGEVFGLMARPGIGKTMLLGHVARAAADAELGHVFFSLEMPAAQIVERIARAHYELPRAWLRERLEANAIDSNDYARAFSAFVLVDTPGLSVAQMAARLRQLQLSRFKGTPVRLVTIDHLGLIGGDRKMNTYDRVSTQARELKEFAKRFNCTVLLAIQVNRDAGGDGSKELGLGAARDSGVVEEAVDYLVAVRRLDRSQTLGSAERERYRDVLFAKVVKNRHGSPDDEIAIRLDPRTLRLREDPDLKPAEDDLGRIAAAAGKGRR